MNVALRKPMTREEFFAWADGRTERYEYDGIRPVAMTGGFANHARIVGNINFQLRLRLGDGPYEALASEAGIATSSVKTRYPDGLVTCTGFDGRDKLVPDPVTVFEVVSVASNRTDRIIKVDEYHGVPSIRRYVLVELSFVGLAVLWRQHPDEPWRAITLQEDDTLMLPEIGIEIPVADLYARVTFGIDETDPLA